MTSSVLKKQTVTRMVSDFIASKIVSGVYPGGSQIRQDAIANELGVSRIPVREALLQLEAEGLVNIITHKGAVVSELSVDDAIDLFEARALLEPYLIRVAVKNATETDIALIEEVHNIYVATVRNDGDPETLSRLNWEFHARLLAPSKRRRSLTLVVSLHNSADRYLRMQIEPAEAQKKAVKDHQAILDAYKEGRVSDVVRALKQHMSDASREIVFFLRSKENNN